MTEPNPSPDDAFQRAAAELWMPVGRFALAMTNELSEADDVAQEAFVRLWDRRATIGWDEPILGWLDVTARRIALDRLRPLARALGLRPSPTAAPGVDAMTIERFVDLRVEVARLTPGERASSPAPSWVAPRRRISEALGLRAVHEQALYRFDPAS